VDTRVHRAASDSDFDFTVKRNCSISPRESSCVLGLAMCASFGIAAGFAWFGAWLILPFAGFEMIALAAAFYVNGRHARDYERISLAGGRLLLEARDAERLAQHEFNPAWVRVAERRFGRECCLLLRSHGREFEIGRHLNTERRAWLAAQLRHSLSNH
jgi:uncharacterized membrane protein